MYTPNSGYGQAIINMVSSIIPTFGRIFVVMSETDAGEENYNRMTEIIKLDPNGVVRFHNTLALAYAAVTSNNNDVILLDADSSHSAAMLTVAKNRVHFIGMDGGGRLNSQGTKISTPATDVAASVAVIKNTGTRNTYRNIKIIQQGTNAAQTSGLIDEGEGTYVKNCEMEVNSLLTTVTQGLLFAGDTCHYEDCQIGNSTVLHNVSAQAPLHIKKSNGAYARYSYFVNCNIIQYTTKTDSPCCQVTETDGYIGWISFQNCNFISASLGNGATAGGAMAAGTINAGTSGYLLFDNACNSYNATLFCDAVAYSLNAGTIGDAATLGGGAVAAA